MLISHCDGKMKISIVFAGSFDLSFWFQLNVVYALIVRDIELFGVEMELFRVIMINVA